ncbi:hypothetical protein RclHR1_27140001, partial [Rhizophagus clarus]
LEKKIHGKFRTGDIKWNPKVCIIKKLILSPEQLPTYLLDRPHGRLGVFRCAYTRKELQVISINKKPPPDSVIRRQPERYIPEKILKHRIRKGQLQYLVKWERYSEDESTWKPADRLQEDVPNLIPCYWKVIVDYKNSDEELKHAFKKYLGRNRALKDSLYKKFIDLANKKEKAFAYQIEIEKIMLQCGFVYKKEKEKKDRIINNIRMLADGLDPYDIPVFHGEPEEPIWQSNYWEDEDPDDLANWQSEYSEDPSNDSSDSDEDPDYPY